MFNYMFYKHLQNKQTLICIICIAVLQKWLWQLEGHPVYKAAIGAEALMGSFRSYVSQT